MNDTSRPAIRTATEADLDACARLAAAHRGRGIGLALTRARVEWALEQAGEVFYFTGTANAASLALHSGLGFEEVTRDFWFPGVTFERGGILFRARRG